ncbi:MAG: hybrid sensor histidine kinase/response regulator [Pseudomonadota bacterium]
MTVLIGGAALAAVATMHFSAITLSTTLVTALPWLGLSHILQGTSESTIVGLLVWLFNGLLIQFGIQLHGVSTRAIRVQLEHERLLRELEARSEALDSARKEAIAANEAKSRFLAHASHDLRQPLHAAGLFLESMESEKLGSQANQRIFHKVRSSLAGLSKLFDTLLDVTLLDTGQIEIQDQPVAVREIFDQVESEFTPIAASEDVLLRFVPNSLVVNTDPFVIRRILQNLLSNAIRNAQGGSVLVGCRRRENGVDIQVLDNGIGISETDQKLVFDEFTRLASDRSGQVKSGLGLGLAIVARLAQMLGLAVSVESKLGVGSVFSIRRIAIATDELPITVNESSSTTQQQSLSGKTIWIFDNDPDTLDATVALLRKWECKVNHSNNVSLPIGSRPDLVICDYEFTQDASGIEIIEKCHAEIDEALPAIIISGNSSRELIGAARERGIPLLAKPVMPVRLRAALLHLFGVEQAGGNRDFSGTGSGSYAERLQDC